MRVETLWSGPAVRMRSIDALMAWQTAIYTIELQVEQEAATAETDGTSRLPSVLAVVTPSSARASSPADRTEGRAAASWLDPRRVASVEGEARRGLRVGIARLACRPSKRQTLSPSCVFYEQPGFGEREQVTVDGGSVEPGPRETLGQLGMARRDSELRELA